MRFSDLFPILFIACFAAFFNKFFYTDAYPSFETSSAFSCNSSTIRYPFQTSNRTTSCNEVAFVNCQDDQTTFLCRIGELCYEYVYRVLGGITQSSYSTRSIRIALDIPLDDCSIIPLCTGDTYDKFYLADEYEWGTILFSKTKPPYTANIKNIKEIECSHCRSTNVSCFFVPPPYISGVDYSCSIYYVVLPADQKYNSSDEKNLLKLMQTGFEIKWNISYDCHTCETSGGICYTDSKLMAPVSTASDLIACICTDGAHEHTCPDAICVLSGIISTASIIIIYIRINRTKRNQIEEELELCNALFYVTPVHHVAIEC
ncbi:hypothetical protein KI387_008789 [Taxus chinensis]|uniref:Wall-associated receptor kinase C-terminal domain-containing protein n=1 Tax=Taxus chinensis TaxID=29808 RepID=A0AA38CQ42_TAXCH|nr:hypothetical protein KI387_008789 [Taxus chinensis]